MKNLATQVLTSVPPMVLFLAGVAVAVAYGISQLQGLKESLGQ